VPIFTGLTFNTFVLVVTGWILSQRLAMRVVTILAPGFTFLWAKEPRVPGILKQLSQQEATISLESLRQELAL
jgi:hypothetical protein